MPPSSKEEILSSLLQELRRGTLVLCVLRLLDSPKYGYHLVQLLKTAGIPAEANTLYPLLRRLEGQGLLESLWETSGARPRKYYRSTPLGREIRMELKSQWDAAVSGMNRLWEENQYES